MDTFEELFEETLKDIYYAEKAILKALPKMAKKASSEDLSAAFTAHYEETQQQVVRLEEIFESMGKKARAKKCPAIDGILEEGAEIMKEAKDDTIRDAGMLAAAQAVEHYEISRYGTLKAWAEKLGMDDAASPARRDAAGGKGDRRKTDRACRFRDQHRGDGRRGGREASSPAQEKTHLNCPAKRWTPMDRVKSSAGSRSHPYPRRMHVGIANRAAKHWTARSRET